jgi:hypothetical protein
MQCDGVRLYKEWTRRWNDLVGKDIAEQATELTMYDC